MNRKFIKNSEKSNKSFNPTTGFVLMMLLTLPFSACKNPCEELAERICACQQSQNDRISCQQRRIQNRAQNEVTPSDAELEHCIANLETCTCAALDNQRTDLCGFSHDPFPSAP